MVDGTGQDALIDGLFKTLAAEYGTSLPESNATIGATIGATTAATIAASAIGTAELVVGPTDTTDLVTLRTLGEGGMGRVELAHQRSLEREVAVKMVRHDVESAGPAMALLREARVAGALDHPNIVPVHALFADQTGLPVLVMKRVEGVAWQVLLRDLEHPLWKGFSGDPIARHIELLRHVCNAVHFAHSRGVIHRDIKPENVMVGAFGEVYLIDWGLALRLNHPDELASTALVGTPAYLAPEMLTGAAQVGPHTDVYLLGASLHEALTQKPKHDGLTLWDVLRRAYESAPYEYEPSVPAELAAVCNRATAKEPDARYGSALEFRDALLDFLRHRSSTELATEGARRCEEFVCAAQEGRDETARKLSAESRFAFQQALRSWPENDMAKGGLQEFLEHAIAFELKHRNPGAAEALLAELIVPRPKLAEQLRVLSKQRQDEERAKSDLAQLRHEGSFAVNLAQRASMQLWFMIFMALASAAAFVVEQRGTPIFTLKNVIPLQALALVAVSTGLFWGRKHLLSNQSGRQYATVVLAVTAGLFVNSLLGSYAGISLSPVLAIDFSECAVVGVCMAVSFSPLFYRMSALCAVGSLAALLLPTRLSLVCFGMGLAIAAFTHGLNRRA